MSEIFTWEKSAEDGVYKNHTLAAKLLELSALKWTFVQFSHLIPGFGKKKGESVRLNYYKPLHVPDDATLPERTRVPIDQLQMDGRSIKVEPMGRGVEYTSLAEDLSKFSPKDGVQKALKEQMDHVMDNAAAAATKDTKVIFTPTSLTGGTIDTDGTPSSVATQNYTKAHLGVIRDYMANDLHVQPVDGKDYVGLFATKALRGLKDDRMIEMWNMYLRKGDLLYNSEVGRCEGIRLAEVTNEMALSNSIGQGNCTGEAVVFGDDAVGRLEVSAPELRADPNFQGNFGLTKAVMWYALIAFAQKWLTANDRECRTIFCTSQ